MVAMIVMEMLITATMIMDGCGGGVGGSDCW